MTIPGLSSTAFLKILQANGYEILDASYLEMEGVERIMIGKDNHSFTFRVNYFYRPSEVIKRMEGLGVDHIPEEYEPEYRACVEEYLRKQASRGTKGTQTAEGEGEKDK
jgi:hypothetical protein